MKYEDISNKKFNKLTALSYAGKGHRGKALWNCLCDCGKKSIVYTQHLKSGGTKSCGCFQKEGTRDRNRLGAEEGAINEWFTNIRQNARQRNIPITILKEEAFRIGSNPCHYCGELEIEDSSAEQYKSDCIKYNRTLEIDFYEKRKLLLNGLDRKDNTKGYYKDNCVSCCTFCNRAKRDYSYKYFIKKIKEMYNAVSKLEE